MVSYTIYMRGVWHFLKYNNAVPLLFGVLFLSSGVALAANPEIRDAAASAVLSRTEQVVSIDNTYLVGKDLSAYSPTVRIHAVTEDENKYYVSYTLDTISLEDYAWRDVRKEGSMAVSKAGLGPYGDLGMYATRQFKELIASELSYLREAQEREREQVSGAVVATTYGGLIGRFLNATTETLPGYTPVVAAPTEAEGGSFSAPGESSNAPGGAASAPAQSAQVSLQVLGNNPARVSLRSTYIDLGVVVLDPLNTNVGVHTYLDGVEVYSSPSVDTTKDATYVIEYRVTDRLGTTVSASRTIIVGSGAPPLSEEEPQPEESPATEVAAPSPSASSTTPTP